MDPLQSVALQTADISDVPITSKYRNQIHTLDNKIINIILPVIQKAGISGLHAMKNEISQQLKPCIDELNSFRKRIPGSLPQEMDIEKFIGRTIFRYLYKMAKESSEQLPQLSLIGNDNERTWIISMVMIMSLDMARLSSEENNIENRVTERDNLITDNYLGFPQETKSDGLVIDWSMALARGLSGAQ